MRGVEFITTQEEDWSFHCHQSHHTMGHTVLNMIGVKQNGLTEKIDDLM